MGFFRRFRAHERDASASERQWGRRILILAGMCIILGALLGYRQKDAPPEKARPDTAGEQFEETGPDTAGEQFEETGPDTAGERIENTGPKPPTKESPQREEPGLSGTLQIFGSTSMDRVMNALAQAFMEKYPQVTVVTVPAGSSAGIEAVLSGSAHIGCSSRKLTEEEKARGAVEQVLALDGLAVCVEASCGITELTSGQLAELYTGDVTNWSRLGGSELPVVLVGREAGSGTREAFERLLGLTDLCTYANELNSNGAVLARVASVPGAVGYVSFDGLDGSVTVVTVDGAQASPENVKNGAYPLSRPLVMVTKERASGQNEIVQAWFEFALGEEGQEIVEKTGLIPVTDP